jgi:hypothetical protein
MAVVLHNGMLNARVLQFFDGLWSGITSCLMEPVLARAIEMIMKTLYKMFGY